MLINKKTKIAVLLKHHPDALDKIIELSLDFKKLKNPLLRKLMAGRTSIAMASKIGGCTPEDFFKILEPLGFEADTGVDTEEEQRESIPLPDYLKNLQSEQIIHFDVRQILAEGKDPLRDIQQKAKALNTGEALLIINNFEPVPLIKLLEKQGFKAHVQFLEDEVVETYFYKTAESADPIAPDVDDSSSTDEDWNDIQKRFENNFIEIDVRHLEAPMPMMTILEHLETLPEGKALYVNHKRVPVFLLDELNDRKFEYRIKDVQEGEVYLMIYKN